MSEKKFSSIYFDKSVVYKRVKGFMTASLFLAGNLVSTLPVMAAPKPSANIVVDTAPPVNQRPTVDITHNGIDQVNIVHPNDAGVSHNKFNQYNVNEQGQILNNSPTITNTKLAGQITGNPHLKDGKTAHTIINEVTGYSPTKLLGYTEVAGRQAAVIIANPNGITCAGCGFINTSRASLATGKPNLDANGNLQSITVGGGEVGFDGAGGNFAEVPVLDIISRKVRINAPVNGQDIRIVAGRNTYNYADGTATPLASDGTQAPEFAIETSALGGMTGNHIQMLVNEKGAGVRVDGRMASTAGDMQLTADGKLVIAGELSAQNNLNARVDVIENTGTIGANNGINLQGRSLTNSGKIIAKGQQNSNITMSDTLDNSGSIEGQSGLQLSAQKINNRQSAYLHAQKDLSLTGQNLTNNGQISSDTGVLNADINGAITNNNGVIAANNSIVLKASGDIDNSSGQIGVNQGGSITLQSNSFNNQNGLVQTNTGLISLNSYSLNNNNGSIVTNNAPITINAPQIILNNNGQIGAEQSGNISLTTQNNLQNTNGKISTGAGTIFIQSNRLTNNSGKIFSGTDTSYGDLTLRTGDVENSGGVIQATKGAVDATIGNYTDTNGGLIYAGTALQIKASGDMSIANAIQGEQGLSLSAGSLTLSNAQASLSSLSGNGTVTLVNALVNAGNIFVNQGWLAMTAGSVSNNNGQINTDAGALSITANKGGIDNHSGHILTKNDAVTLIASGGIDNSSGQIGSQGNGNITLQSGDLNNQNGLIRTSVGDVSLTIGALNNSSGSILTTSGNMGVHAFQGINNNSGQIGTQQGGNVTITANGDINNSQGQLVTPSGFLTITGNTFDNSSGKVGSNNGNVDIHSNRLINSSGVILAGTDKNAGDLTLINGDVENSNGTIQSTNGSVNATIGSYTDTNKGVIYAGKDLTLNASGDVFIANAIQSEGQFNLQANSLTIANKDASINSLNGNGSLTIINDLINNGSISFSKGSLALDVGSFSNNGTFDIGFGGLNFNIKGDFSNKNGSLIADASDVTITAKGSVDNTNGQIGVKNNGNVTINSQNLLNQGGLIRTSSGDVLLKVTNLYNQQGSVLTNNGQINIQALQGIANNLGKIGIQTLGNLTITAQGDIDNTQGQFVTPDGFVNISGNKLDNSNGQIGALTKGAITLSLQNALQNNQGKIITPLGAINITSGAFTNTNGQVITSSGDLTLTSGDIENSGGVIQATKGLVDARIGSYADTNGGLIYAGKSLTINASGDMSIANALQGQQGLSLSAGSLTLSNAEASLSGLSGNGTVTLVNALINAGNIFVNQGALTIIAGSVENNGQINTNAGALSITANKGGIDNHSGRILTKNDAINLKATGNLDNSSGQIGSQKDGNVTLQSGDLNNQQGLTRTGVGNIGLTVGSLNNNQGSILTTQGNMQINASQGISNNSGQIGTQASGNVTIIADGDINNLQGQFVTPVGLLKITGNNLDNSSGQIGSNNGTVEIQSGHLINNSGTIIAGANNNLGDLTLTSGDIENSGGTIQSTNGSVNATIGNYTDTDKGVLYAGKDLTLNASGDVSIANALQSQGLFTLQANSLNVANKDASISSLNNSVSLTIANALINQGSIYTSNGGLTLTEGSLENTGSLYGKNMIALSIGQAIQNKGIFANNVLTGGMIQSDGDISLTASTVENTGFIQSLHGINLRIAGDIQNQSFGENSGVIQSGSGKQIQITAQNLQNNNGQILSDADLNITTENMLANSGYLQANTVINLTTPNLNNNGGSILALGGDLTIGVSQPTAIDNTNGKIQSNGNIILNGSSYQSSELSYLTAQQQLQANFSGDVVNNGQMVAGSDLILTADTLSNGIQGLVYSNNGNVALTTLGQNGLFNYGNIQAIGNNSQLSINASTLTNQGVILSKNGAVLNASQQINNQRNQNIFGQIITQGGDLSINAPVVNNDGLMISPANLTVTTQTLANTGYVSADNLLTVTSSNSIANSAAAFGLNFNGTPLVSGSLIGGTVQLLAPDIQNQNGWIQGNNGLTLTANSITNSQKGVMLSTNGDVTLQGIGSTEGNIAPVASVVNNNSNIQAYNRLWIATQNLDNTNGVLSSDSGNIRLDQGSSGAALQSFNNAGGTLQSSKDLTLNFSQLDSAEGSKILAKGLLTLTIGSDFTNNGTLWGGQGLNLTLASLVNSAGSIIGADNNNVTINAQNGNITNYGVIKNLDTNTGNITIHAQNLTNDAQNIKDGNGSILSNSNIDLQLSGQLTNQNGGEITAYNAGNIHFTGSGFDNAGLLLAGGTITGNSSGDINNRASGYIYGSQGVSLTSNTQITNNAQGQMGINTGVLSLTAPTLSFAQGGQVITNNGNMVLNASSSMSNHGWLQSMGDIQITTPILNNTSVDSNNIDAAIVSMHGAMTIQSDQNGNGLTLLNNNNGILQSAGNLTIYTKELQSQNGKILTYDALGKGNLGDIILFANAQNIALSTLNLSNEGIIQSSRDMSMTAQSSGLSSTGSIFAAHILNATIEGDLKNSQLSFSSLGGGQNPAANLIVHGDYEINQDGGVTSLGDLNVTANDITNNGVLLASNNMGIITGNLTNNIKGLISSTNNLTITASGNIDNFGVLQADQGSMVITATGDVKNTGGLIRTQSANSDIILTANSFENKYSGTLSTETVNTTTVYQAAINGPDGPYAGLSNTEFTQQYMNITGIEGWVLNEYYYASNVKILQINAPTGMYTADGKPASGFFYFALSNGLGNKNSRVEIRGKGDQDVLHGTSAIISAGRDLKVTTTGAIINDISHIEAGRNMDLKGASLTNHGLQSSVTYTIGCFNNDFCRMGFSKDASNNPNPPYVRPPNTNMDGHSMNPTFYVWGSNSVNNGLGSTIVAGGNLIGQFSGEVNNTTIIQGASKDDFVTDNRPLPSGQNLTTTNGENGKGGLTGPGNSDLSSNGSDTNSITGQDNNLGYSGVTNPQGVDPGLHVTLPGFNGSGSASVNDILSSLTGGQALFRPNPNVSGSNSNLNGITGGGITGGGANSGNSTGSSNVSSNPNVTINGSPSVQSPTNPGNTVNNNTGNTVSIGDITAQNPTQPNVNTSSVQSGSNYLIETRPQYTSVNEFYGSQYLLNHLSINGSYMFLGDAGFDTQYIQQQYIQATGQSYPGGTYMTASDAMKTMLDNAANQKDRLGLQFGTALTAEQQSKLDEDIVWYVPQVVDGQTVLVPQLYLSPKTDILAGAAIKGKNVNITAGSINNSGLMQGTNSIALTATNGDISNIGGTIKGGNISLNAQNGSVINSDTVNNYLVNGGTGSYLGSQGQILASGTLGIQASDSITTHGGTIQSGSDLAMKAGTINIGSMELNAAASSVTHASDGTLSFVGNQTKNYGTTITAGGNASLQSTAGDLSFSGSSLNAGGNVSLSSAGNIALNAVTDSGFSDVKGHKSGAFNSSSFENKNAYTNDVGSFVTAGGQLDAVAKKDVSISGGLAATNDVNIIAKEGGITENALTSTSDSYTYHHTKKTGFFGNEAGLSAQVGTKKVTDKNSASSVTHTSSTIASTGGNVNMSADNGDININGSNVLAKQDINMAGNNINFNTVTNTTSGDKLHKDSFTGLTVAASGLLSNAAQTGFSTANATDSNTAILNGANLGYAGLNAGMGKAGLLGANGGNVVDYGLMGAAATIGHESNKSHTITQTMTDVGSTVTAGGKVNINAKNDINATGSNISGNDVIFNAGGDINLNAGYKTTESKSTSSSNKFGVGATTSLGATGGSFGLTGNVSFGFGNSKSSSKTAIDTVVNGTNSVVMNNHNGDLNINGAQITNKNADGTISDGSIAINTGNLNITTPQNTNKFDSDQFNVGVSASTPIGSGFGWSKGDAPQVPYSNGSPFGLYQNMHNDYQATEQTMSGISAGKGGVNINVSGTTTLTGGSITSAADSDKNQITTGSLVANSLDNHSEWSGLNIKGTETISNKHGINAIGTQNGQEVMGIPGNVLGTAATGFTGNSVSHDEHSVTSSVIGGNITINSGSTTGIVSRDPNAANGYIKDQFNAAEINSNFALQNKATEVMNNYANLGINTVVTANNNAEKKQKDDLHTTINTATQGDKDLNSSLNSAVDHNDDFSLVNKNNASALAGGLSAIGGAIIGGGNVGTTTAGVAGGLAGNAIYNNAFPTDRPLGKDKNPLDPKSPNYNHGETNTTINKGLAQDYTPDSSSQQQAQNTHDKNKPSRYDDQTDLNKLGSSIIKDGIIGGMGAIAGILTGGNIAIDTATGGLTGLTMKPPALKKKEDPKAKAADKKNTPAQIGDKK
ncbi:hemagglutinin repeat-containing protein [Commensalibacter papalotli (ex Botero et al. 2024)]|uniref:hemagglutinin repeat-containing protein n=1 Tax=Commensalibacter papalotli (ex Botero et al. 2024) TaxID=2972766 RepID=UPI0022FF76EF|nr:hemagglutinin repeat-containing protein [Commensalibacter papalotli (ex Botero et al. 2024)]CAI3955037.1 Autotransporter translocation and assembly protein TamB (TamB) (PDB:5VTG) [Commensalibacter papalotli (ex Botero et al. 2024)]